MVTTDSIVGDPEEIKSLNELDLFLQNIKEYEQTNRCSAVVLLVQRRQFGGLYEIVSEERSVKSNTAEIKIRNKLKA